MQDRRQLKRLAVAAANEELRVVVPGALELAEKLDSLGARRDEVEIDVRRRLGARFIRVPGAGPSAGDGSRPRRPGRSPHVNFS
jgi:hypothetical protein